MKFIPTNLLLLLSVLLLISCEKNPGEMATLPNVHEFDLAVAKPLSLIPDSTPPLGSFASTNNIGDVAVDEFGRIYLVNVFKKRIEVYNPQKSSLIPITKLGMGPQVLQNPSVITIQNGLLYVYDTSLKHIFAISLQDYTTAHATKLIPPDALLQADSTRQIQPYSMEVVNDGNYLVAFQVVHAPDERLLYYYRINTDGQIISDQLFQHKNKSFYVDQSSNKTVYMMMPYERETLVDTDSRGNIYVLNTEHLLIKVFDSNGTYLKAYYYPFENKSLLETDVLSRYTNVDERRAVRGAPLPETWPAAARLLIDDEDRIWVAAIAQDLNTFRWYVFESSGEVLGTIIENRHKELMDVRKGRVYFKSYNSRQFSDEVRSYVLSF